MNNLSGEFLDTGITYDKRSPNWPDWNTLLADSPVLCADGEALTGFKLLPARNVFRCLVLYRWPRCRDLFSLSRF